MASRDPNWGTERQPYREPSGGDRERRRTPGHASRRQLLRATAGVALSAGIAGCSGITSGETTTPSSKEVSGEIRAPDGEPMSGATIFAASVTEGDSEVYDTVTGSDGSFSFEVPWKPLIVGLAQNSSGFPRDGVPDTYGIADLPASETDLGTTTIEPAYLLTITVVDPSGDPVSGVPVDVLQDMRPDEELGRVGVVDYRTDSRGRYVAGEGEPGIEVRGTIDVVVRPSGGSGFAEKTRTVDVRSDRSLEVQLEEN